MGVHKNVGSDKFPRQSEWLGKDVRVMFGYNSDDMIDGRIVRDDSEDPFTMLIQLSDNRIVNATECQYQLK